MNLALLQLNYTVGDLKYNAEKIIKAVKSVAGRVDLCITSELALTGYPPKDLLMYEGFVDESLNTLQYIAQALKKSPALLLGCIVRNTSGTGKPLYNAAAFIEHGEVKHYFYKSLIPTYDVFDEDRYFEPGRGSNILEFKGHKLGITICEDAWTHDPAWQFPRYAINPLEKLAQGHVDAIINLSASPYYMQKQTTIREPLIKGWVKKHTIPFYYVNQVGGNDELIFDGSSFHVDKFGACVAKANAFEEAILLVDMYKTSTDPDLSNMPIEEELFKALVCGTRDYLAKCGFKKALLGLSGGIDSALVLAIAVHALGKENVLAVLMPSIYSSQGSMDDAMAIAKTLGVKTHTLPISDLMQGYQHSLKDVFLGLSEDTTEENLQSRIRGNLLMAMSNKLHAALLTTGNKSELSVGYCTIYGDMCGGLAVISDVYKTMVYRLSNWINASSGREIIPKAIIMKAPSAELRPNQSDQDSLPPYDVLDAILYQYIELHQRESEMIKAGFDEKIVTHIIKLVTKAEFKRRQAAPGLKVTARAYGAGWRMPIAAKLS
jgi:NAD+ synthase (glutamine-hydrolysing)